MAKYQQYDEYKDSGVEWLDVIPNHWNTVSLKMLIDVRDGTHETPSYVEKTDNSYPLVTSKDVTSGQIDLTDCKHISQQDYESIIKRSAVSEGDILMPMIGTVGSPVLVEERLEIAIKNLALFRTSENNDKITAKFLHYFLNSKECSMQFSLEGRGGVQNFVSLGTLRSLGLPLISLEDQVQIANFLDFETAQIDTLIEKQQTLIQLLKEKRQAVISHAVTKGLNPDTPMKDSGVEWLGEVPEHWEIMAISKLTQKITNGYVGPTRDILVPKGVPYIQATHIKRGNVNFDDAYFVREEWSKKHSKSILKEQDVLVVQTGAGTGDIGLVTSEEAGYNCHALIILQPKANLILGGFLSFTLQSDYGYAILYSIRTGGMHPHLNCGEVKYVKVSVPPIDEQQEIIAYIERMKSKFNDLINNAEQAIQLMQERRTALISAAVTGKIDVRGWVAPE